MSASHREKASMLLCLDHHATCNGNELMAVANPPGPSATCLARLPGLAAGARVGLLQPGICIDPETGQVIRSRVAVPKLAGARLFAERKQTDETGLHGEQMHKPCSPAGLLNSRQCNNGCTHRKVTARVACLQPRLDEHALCLPDILITAMRRGATHSTQHVATAPCTSAASCTVM